jgi:hypothetical protein
MVLTAKKQGHGFNTVTLWVHSGRFLAEARLRIGLPCNISITREVRQGPVAPADETTIIVIYNIIGRPCAKRPGFEDRGCSTNHHDHRVGRMTTIYQPPAQRGYRVFTGMGFADAIAGGGEAAASIVVRNVDDQHDVGSLRLSHADDHGPEAPGKAAGMV